MAVTLTEVVTTELGSGLRVLTATGTCGQNYQAGEVCSLSSYFDSDTNVIGIPTSISNDYHIVFNTGSSNAAACNIQLFSPDASNSNIIFQEIAAATNVATVSFRLFAIGKQY